MKLLRHEPIHPHALGLSRPGEGNYRAPLIGKHTLTGANAYAIIGKARCVSIQVPDRSGISPLGRRCKTSHPVGALRQELVNRATRSHLRVTPIHVEADRFPEDYPT